MLALSSNLRYFIATEPTDMRKSFDGLAGIVRNQLQKDPVSGAIFIFLNKNRNQIKLLYWDGDGFAIFHKRLERGNFAAKNPKNPDRELKKEELLMLLEGLDFDKMKQKKRFILPQNS
jgi:transposase